MQPLDFPGLLRPGRGQRSPPPPGPGPAPAPPARELPRSWSTLTASYWPRRDCGRTWSSRPVSAWPGLQPAAKPEPAFGFPPSGRLRRRPPAAGVEDQGAPPRRPSAAHAGAVGGVVRYGRDRGPGVGHARAQPPSPCSTSSRPGRRQWAHLRRLRGRRRRRRGRRLQPPVDAIFTAANYLCRNGAAQGRDVAGAIFAYNHADWYVTRCWPSPRPTPPARACRSSL
jgi:hypothetical protein